MKLYVTVLTEENEETISTSIGKRAFATQAECVEFVKEEVQALLKWCREMHDKAVEMTVAATGCSPDDEQIPKYVDPVPKWDTVGEDGYCCTINIVPGVVSKVISIASVEM